MGVEEEEEETALVLKMLLLSCWQAMPLDLAPSRMKAAPSAEGREAQGGSKWECGAATASKTICCLKG